MAFTVGQIVQLKSGGPKMTVQAVSADSVTCSWFDKASLRDGTFKADMLQEPRELTITKLIEEGRKRAGLPSRES
jgi:uncharacterized protein YodC (DUF2158 family)